MRRLVVGFVVATVLSACGGAAAPVPTATPTGVPTLAPTPSPSVSATPSATVSQTGSGAFVVTGLAAMIDSSADAPDPSTFRTSFTSDTPAIYVPFQLGPGLAGKVTSTWKSSIAKDVVASFNYTPSAPWAYFKLTRSGGFIPSDYQEVLMFEPTGESVTLSFTVTGPPATPAPASSGTAFTLLRMATSVDRSKQQPDPATYTDSYPTTATVVYVVFTLRSGLAGKVTLTMTRNGSPVIKPVSLNITVTDGWNDFHVDFLEWVPGRRLCGDCHVRAQR